jgi:lipopolysaccharide biosynthesis regulator YciM
MKKRFLNLGVGSLIGFWMFGAFMPVLSTEVGGDSTSNQLAQAETPVDCKEIINWPISSKLQEEFNQIQTLFYYEKSEEATTQLLKVFNGFQRLTDETQKASLVEQIFTEYNNQPPLLDQFKDLYEKTGTIKQLPLILKPALATLQTLNPNYAFIRAKSFSTVARLYAEVGETEQANQIILQALEAEKNIQGAEFKTPALIEIARAFVGAGEPEKATQILAQAEEQFQLVTDLDAYQKAWILEPIARTYAQAGQFEKATQVAEKIVDAQSYQEKAFLVIAQEYAQAGKFEEGLQITNKIKTTDLKANALTEVALTSVKQGNVEKGTEVFSQALAVAQTESQETNRHLLLANLISRYAESGNIDQTLEQVQLIPDSQNQARALSKIAVQSAKLGNIEKASVIATQVLEKVATIEEPVKKLDVLSEMIRSYKNAKLSNQMLLAAQQLSQVLVQSDMSLDHMDKMQNFILLKDLSYEAIAQKNYAMALQMSQLMPMSEGYRDRGNILYQVAQFYANSGDFDQAIQLVENIEDPFRIYRLRILAGTGLIAEKAGKTELSSQLLAQAMQEVNEVTSASEQAYALSGLAIEYSKAGKAEKAQELLKSAVEMANNANDESTLQRIMEELNQAAEYTMAAQVAAQIKDEYQRGYQLGQIAEPAIKSEQDQAVFLIIKALAGKPREQAGIFLSLADREIAAGNFDKASQILSETLPLIRTIPGPESQIIHIKEGLDVDDESDRGSLYGKVAEKYAQIKQFDTAQQVAQNIENTTDRNRLIQRLGCYQ